jgi:coenzyme F420-reducing hydrogenase delta subunit
VIELLLRGGTPGVIVCGCPPRDCVSREGPKWLHERVFNDREAELQPRVDRRRVRLATFAAGDLAGSVAAFDAFARDVAILDQPDRDEDGPIDAACDRAPTDVALR